MFTGWPLHQTNNVCILLQCQDWCCFFCYIVKTDAVYIYLYVSCNIVKTDSLKKKKIIIVFRVLFLSSEQPVKCPW